MAYARLRITSSFLTTPATLIRVFPSGLSQIIARLLAPRRVPLIALIVAGRVAGLAMGTAVHVTAMRRSLLRAAVASGAAVLLCGCAATAIAALGP